MCISREGNNKVEIKREDQCVEQVSHFGYSESLVSKTVTAKYF